MNFPNNWYQRIFSLRDIWEFYLLIDSTNSSTTTRKKKLKQWRKLKFLLNGTSCRRWSKFWHVGSEDGSLSLSIRSLVGNEEDYNVFPLTGNQTIGQLKNNKYKKTTLLKFFHSYNVYKISECHLGVYQGRIWRIWLYQKYAIVESH